MVERQRSFLTAVRRTTLTALLLAILPAGQALAAPGSAKPSAPKPTAPKPTAADLKTQARAQALQRQLDLQYAEIERISEQLVKAEEVERQLRRQQADLQLLRRAFARQLATSQARMALLRQGPPQQAALDATAQSVQQTRHRTSDLDRVRSRVAFHLVRQQRLHNGVEARRKQLDLLNKRLEATLKGLDARLRGALAAQQQQAELQRRAAYSNWAASLGVQGQPAWMRSGHAADIAVAFAMRQLGKPYQWGAEGPNSFDCSGLTSASYLAAGVRIPRVAADQFYAGPHVGVADLLAGDLVFYADDPSNPATIHHVGMYIGKGLMIHAPHTGDVVRIASIWRSGFAGAVRVIPGAVRPGATPPAIAPVPVPTPPMSTYPPPTTAKKAPPTTHQAPPTTRQAPPTTKPGAPSTTKPGAPSTTAPTTSRGSSTTSTGTTTSTTTTTEPPTTAASSTAPPTSAASTTSQEKPTTTSSTTTTTTTTTTTQSSGSDTTAPGG
jgi:peptidoglycan DL-endopeptidase CwlO